MTCDAFTSFSTCKIRRQVLLLLLWVAGLITGCSLFYTCSSFVLSLMRSAFMQPVSIVGLLASIMLPFLLTYLSIATNNPVYILAVCFIKALSFSFTGAYLVFSCLSAHWLVRMLFLFSDYCILPLLFWIWLRFMEPVPDELIKFKFSICTLAGIAVAIFDFCVISPLLCGLF